jgi:hypothetical protein
MLVLWASVFFFGRCMMHLYGSSCAEHFVQVFFYNDMPEFQSWKRLWSILEGVFRCLPLPVAHFLHCECYPEIYRPKELVEDPQVEGFDYMC